MSEQPDIVEVTQEDRCLWKFLLDAPYATCHRIDNLPDDCAELQEIARHRIAALRVSGEGWRAFNVNENVRIKLTPHGLEHLRKQHDEFNASCNGALGEFMPPKVDDEGWSKLQLWSAMQDLGGAITMGLPVPFETTILLDAKAIRLPEPPAQPLGDR